MPQQLGFKLSLRFMFDLAPISDKSSKANLNLMLRMESFRECQSNVFERLCIMFQNRLRKNNLIKGMFDNVRLS